MDIQQLKDRLGVNQGQVSVSETTLTPAMGEFLRAFHGSAPIVIADAKRQEGSDTCAAVRISGTATFLNVPNLPVSARFGVDAGGEAHALLRYQLRGTAPGPNSWTFSQSFPNLPPVFDYDPPVTGATGSRPFLDALALFDTYAVLSTHAGQDPETGVPLEPGINFVSKLRPLGQVGVLEAFLGKGASLTLYGTIRVPQLTERFVPLAPLEHPWDKPSAQLPGIHLQAVLDLDCKLGKLVFQQARFHVYSPISTEWLASNASYAPKHGYTGSLAIPSANIELALGADLEWNLPSALLYGNLQGVTLGKLAHLLDLAGTGSLSPHLPQELQSAVDALEGLALENVALDLVYDGLLPTVRAVFITIGLPGLKWKVWGEHLIVENLGCRFAIRDPFNLSAALAARGTAKAGLLTLTPPPSLSVTVLGTLVVEGVPLSIQASSEEDFMLRAWTQDKFTLPLETLLKSHAPGIPSPGPLSVESIGMSVLPGRSYSMSALLADSPPWVLGLGRKGREQLTIRDVALNFAQDTGQPLTGSFAGKLAFDDELILQVSYDIPGNFTVRSTFPRVNLTKLMDRLCDVKLALPGGFNLVLENASVLIQKRNESYTFQVATGVAGFGLFAFEVRQVPGQGWGFAAGMDLGGSRLSQLPGLSVLKVFEDGLKLQKLMLLVSSLDSANFQFPDMAQFNRPQLNSRVSLPPQAAGASAGLMVFAEWQLNEADRTHSLLKKLLGLGGTESVALAISENPLAGARLYLDRRGTIQGHPFEYKLGAELKGTLLSMFLTGSLTVNVMGHAQTFDVTGLFVPGGMLLAADMKGSTSIDCGPFKLSNVALEVGVDWAGVPSLGVAATIDVKNFESSVAVFFDSTNPSRSLVAGSLGNLSLKDVTDTLLGGIVPSALDGVLKTISVKGTHQFSIPGALASELDNLQFDKVAAAFANNGKVTIPSAAAQLLLVVNQRGAAWHLTDLTRMRHYRLKKSGDAINVSIEPQFYFAPQATSIGTVSYPQGYYVNAALDILGYKAEGTIDIAKGHGISVDARLDKLVIGNEKLFSLTADKGGGGPVVSVSTFMQPDHPVPEFRLPHFYVNGSLSMLGLRCVVFATLTVHGLEFELHGNLVPGANFNVQVRFGSGGLEGSGKVKVGVGTLDLGVLGKVHLDTDLEASLEIHVDSKDTRVTAESGFEFTGQHVKIEKFQLDVQSESLVKLPETLSKKVEEALRSVLKDATKVEKAVEKTGKQAEKEVEKTGKKVGKTLKKLF